MSGIKEKVISLTNKITNPTVDTDNVELPIDYRIKNGVLRDINYIKVIKSHQRLEVVIHVEIYSDKLDGKSELGRLANIYHSRGYTILDGAYSKIKIDYNCFGKYIKYPTYVSKIDLDMKLFADGFYSVTEMDKIIRDNIKEIYASSTPADSPNTNAANNAINYVYYISLFKQHEKLKK